MPEKNTFQRFKPNEIALSFPETADTLLLDIYLTDEEAASARVFRVYRETPPHYHAGSDEYLYVPSGTGTFWMGADSNVGEFAPGDLLFFKRRVVHALPKILEGPVVFLSFFRHAETRPDGHHLRKPWGWHARKLCPREKTIKFCDAIFFRSPRRVYYCVDDGDLTSSMRPAGRCSGGGYALDEIILLFLRFGADGKSIQDAGSEGVSNGFRGPVAKISLA
jgi:quercetin dioxygenase-like cupin family protein